MYYLIGWDHNDKVYIVAYSEFLEFIKKQMKLSHNRIGNNPNDWRMLKIMKEVEE